MPRVVKEHTVRRDEILDIAQAFFYARGYDGTTIQAIIDAAEIAKGTFYHYFSGKADLVAGLVDRMTGQVLNAIRPVLDSDLSAPEKFRGVFRIAGLVKLSSPEILVPLVKMYFGDQNLYVRHKMAEAARSITIPLYTRIIEEGNREGVFAAPDAEETAELLVDLHYGVGMSLLTVVLGETGSRLDAGETAKRLAAKVRSADRAIERLLGAAEGSLELYAAADIAARMMELARLMELAPGSEHREEALG